MTRAKNKKDLTPEEKRAQALVPPEEQPYEVPGNWRWVRVGAISSLHRGVSYKKSEEHKTCLPNDCLILRGGNVKEGYIEFGQDDIFVDRSLVSDEQIVRKNDVIIVASTGSAKVIGRTGISITNYTDVAFGAFLMLLRPCNQSDPRYLGYFFQSSEYRNRIKNLASGVNINNIRADYITDTPCPLPPLSEQNRIVVRIERLFAALDTAKEKAQSVLASCEARKAAILHKAFTGELTAEWRRTYSVSLDSWQSLTLNDVAEYKKGPFGSSITKKMFVPKGVDTFKVYEQGNAIRKTVHYGHYYIDKNKYLELKGFAVHQGDIIISCAGTIGEVYKLPNNCESGIINQALMRVRLYPNIIEQYFIYYFGEIIKSNIIDQSNGTAIKNIPPFKVMKAMEIKLPSLSEQKIIIDLLDDILNKQTITIQNAKQVLSTIENIKHSILARAFRGELGTNDPAEPAAELPV